MAKVYTEPEIALKIKRLRQSQGMNQDAFANAIGVSRTTVCTWETGKAFPALRTIEKINSTFDVNLIDDDAALLYTPDRTPFAMVLRVLPDLSQRELHILSAAIDSLLDDDPVI